MRGQRNNRKWKTFKRVRIRLKFRVTVAVSWQQENKESTVQYLRK